MKKYLTILVFFTALVGCKEVDLGDANVNTNEPKEVGSAPLLSGGQRAIQNIYGASRGAMYVQYLCGEQYEDQSQYKSVVFDYSYYYRSITNLNAVIAKPESTNQSIVAELTKAYYFQFMTDAWGMIPYTTANDIEVVFNKFDTQEDIYKSLFEKIETNLNKIDASNVKGDIVFSGDMDKWKKFGYSLMMNMALRVSKADPVLGKKYYNISKANVVTDNTDNLFFPFIEDSNYDNPWYERFVEQGRTDYLCSETLSKELIGTGTSADPEDPRTPFYLRVAEEGSEAGNYHGGKNGEKNSPKKTSLISADIVENQTAKGYIYTSAQMLFNMAEAASLGWDTDPATKYNNAVTASMLQWGVAPADAATYVAANPFVDGKSIGKQKWLALFMQGYESWFDWRKQAAHGNELPLVKAVGSTTAGIPNRHGYPLSASGANAENYKKAIAAQGPDDQDTKVWWAK